MASVVNPANGITLARMLAFFPFWHFVAAGQRHYALFVLVTAGFADLWDGYVAKKFNCQTKFGELFDAIADGALYGACYIVLTLEGWVPRTQIFILLGLGVANAVFRFIYGLRAGRAVNFVSPGMEKFVCYVVWSIAFAVMSYDIEYFYWLGVVAMAIIVAHDAKRMLLDPVPSPSAGDAAGGAAAA